MNNKIDVQATKMKRKSTSQNIPIRSCILTATIKPLILGLNLQTCMNYEDLFWDSMKQLVHILRKANINRDYQMFKKIHQTRSDHSVKCYLTKDWCPSQMLYLPILMTTHTCTLYVLKLKASTISSVAFLPALASGWTL